MTDRADSATAVVIVNYRTMHLTARAVSSVITEPEVREVVVVDNASGDGSAEFLRGELTDPRARVVAAPRNLGFGQGVNLGADLCTAPLLFLLNSDATVVPGALAVLAGTLLAEASTGVVAPAIYGSDGTNLQPGAHGVFPTLGTILRRTNSRPPETLTPDWVSGVAMLLRRSDFESLGGFDTEFEMYLEDVDLCRRLRLMGKHVQRQLDAGVVHVGNQSWESYDRALKTAHRSRGAYFRKAGLSTGQRLAIEGIRLLRLGLQRTRLRRSLPDSPREATIW